MNDNIKEILDIERYRNKDDYVENINLLPSEIHKLLDYITNLQRELEKAKADLYSANQVISDLIDVHEENEKLKELCDKYEEEHSNEFQCWKRDRKELLDKRARIEKAVKYLKSKEDSLFMTFSDNMLDHDELIDKKIGTTLLNILNGRSDE